jgi:raffinose/stachyose/melibiose transport system permease protein
MTVQRSMNIVVKYLVLILLACVIVIPVLIAVFGGFKTNSELQLNPFGLPTVFRWQNHLSILQSSSFWRQFMNSMIIVAGTAVITVVLASMLAFAFSRLEFKGREILFNFFTLGLLFPITIAFLPVFIQVRQLNLLDSYWGVILPLVAFGIPGSMLILRSFFKAIPIELEDASYIDGCTPLQFFFYVLLPLARPAIGAVLVLQTIVAWNEYFLPLVVLNSDKKWPLTLGIMQFQGQYGTEWGLVMAFVTILLVPAILFYLLTQRYIVTGLTGGELKG